MTGEFAFQSLLLSEDVKGAGAVPQITIAITPGLTTYWQGRVLRDFAKYGSDAAL